MNTVAKNIKRLRVHNNLTQDELADKMHVTRQTVSNWETEKNQPDIETLITLASILGTDINEIIYGNKKNEYPKYQKKYIKDMIDTLLESLNDRIIRGEPLPESEIQSASKTFLDYAIPFNGHGFENNPLRSVYWHVSAENGKYPRNFMGVLPKTAIFANNFLELETLRFLRLYSRDKRVDEMCGVTLERLSRACIGRFCEKGECVGASISALRFLSAVKPDSEDTNDLASKLIAYYNSHPQGMAGYSRNLPRFYVFLALSDIQSDNAKAFLAEKTDFMKTMLTRGCLTGPAVQDTYNVRLLYILRNALSKVDGYAYVRENPVYIREDGRCVCNI